MLRPPVPVPVRGSCTQLHKVSAVLNIHSHLTLNLAHVLDLALVLAHVEELRVEQGNG